MRAPRRAAGYVALGIVGVLGFALISGTTAGAVDGCSLAGVKQWDAGAGTTNWFTPANWAGDTLPGATDHVCINAGTSVAFSGTATVQSVDIRKPFTVSSGTLTIGNAGQPSTISAGFTMTGGTITGASPRTLTGALSWSAGTIGGTGATTVPAATTLTLSGSGFKSFTGPVANQGTLAVGGTGTLQLAAGGVLTNAGSLNFTNDASLTFSSDGRILNQAGATVAKTAGVTTSLAAPIDNDGTVRADAGTLLLSTGTPAATSSAGKWRAMAAGEVIFDSGAYTLGAGAGLIGPGPVTIDGATVVGPLNVPLNASLRLLSGTLRAVSPDQITVASGGTVAAQGATFKAVEGILSNAGTITVTDSLRLNTGQLLNTGTIDLANDAFIDSSGTSLIANNGLGLIKHTGDPAGTGSLSVPVQNNAQLTSLSGRLDLNNGTPAGSPSDGTYGADAGATLAFTGGVHTLTNAAHIVGAGAFRLEASTLAGPFTIDTATTLTAVGGTLSGPTAAGSQATIAAGATLSVQTASFKQITGNVSNAGTTTVDGTLRLQGPATFANAGTLNLVGQSTIDSSGTTVIQNLAGAFVKKTGLNTSTGAIEAPLSNDGAVRAESGTLTLGEGTGVGDASGGTYSALNGGPQLTFIGGTHTLDGAKIAGPGPVEVAGATVRGKFTVKAGAKFRESSGGIEGPTPASGDTILIEANATVTVSNASFKSVTGALRNEGTTVIDGYVRFDGPTTFTNAGTVTAVGAAVIDASGSPNLLQNLPTGLIRKTGGNASVAVIATPVDNDGVVRSDGGTLDLTGGTGAANSSSGEYTAAAGRTVRFAGGIHSIATGGQFTGPGAVTLTAGALAGPWTVSTGGTLNFTGGELEGPSVGLGPTALIEAGATVTIQGTNFKSMSGAIHNDGLVVHSGFARADSPVTVENAGEWDLVGAPEFGQSGTTPNLFVNLAAGLIKKVGDPASVGIFGVPLENDGIVRAESGRVDLTNGSGGVESGGEYTASAGSGARVRLAGGTHQLGSTGKFTGPGFTGISAGVVQGPFVVKAGAVFLFDGGDLKAPLAGAGQILFESGSVVRVRTGDFKQLHGPVRNNGTIRWAGYARLATSGVLTNTNTIEISGASQIDFSGAGNQLLNTVSGVVTSLFGTSTVDAPFKNNGQVSVVAGALNFTNPLDLNANGVLLAGTWHAAGKLGLKNGGLKNNKAEIVLDGPTSGVTNTSGVNALGAFAINSGSFTINGRPLGLPALFTNTGTLAIGPGAAITGTKVKQTAGLTTLDANATLTLPSGFELQGGVLSGGGTLTGPLLNMGTTPPERLSAGDLLDVDGDYTQSATGVFDVLLSNTGTDAAQQQIAVSGNGALDGTLRIRFTDSFVPIIGDNYLLGTFAARSGTFSTLDIEEVVGFEFVPFYTSTGFGITVLAAA